MIAAGPAPVQYRTKSGKKEPLSCLEGLFPDKHRVYWTSHVKPAVTDFPIKAVSPGFVPVVTNVQTTL